jgi:hypothetical protein
MTQKKGVWRSRRLRRARGWFFAAAETLPYEPRGAVIGQARPDSCVAACCRMLLNDAGIEVPEAFIRAALRIDQESGLGRAVVVLD